MKILFVTRKYPPSVGGMENMAFHLHESLSKIHNVTLIAWGGSNGWLIVIYPILFARAFLSALIHRPDVVLLQDGVLAPMAPAFRHILRLPVAITIHGLEVTYGNPVYRAIVLRFLSTAKLLIAVSSQTKRETEKIVSGSKISVIKNGVADDLYLSIPGNKLRNDVADEIGIKRDIFAKKKILLTTGRMVRRKGIQWFIVHVIPEIKSQRQDTLYIICGTGPEEENIKQAIIDNGLVNDVLLLGRVPGDLLRKLYNIADIFIMPNIPVKNDIEGFGLVALEAASCGTKVIASGIDGIGDAIDDGRNGYLVNAQDKGQYMEEITKILNGKDTLKKTDIRKYVLKNCSWDVVARQYTERLGDII